MDTINFNLTINDEGQILLPPEVVKHFDDEIYICPDRKCLRLIAKKQVEESIKRNKEFARKFGCFVLSSTIFLCIINENKITLSHDLRKYILPNNENELILILDGEKGFLCEKDCTQHVLKYYF